MITDPPAGIGFMGKEWDSDKGGRTSWIAWLEGIMREALRVLKPGAHALVWALPRTSHWTATAIEDAGFEIRDVVTHHFGTGFPKSLNVSKAIDEAAGAKREITGPKVYADGTSGHWSAAPTYAQDSHTVGLDGTGKVNTAPATDAAKQWDGWGTALKPASEHWILARKPLTGTVATNVQAHGTGALNIDASRIEGVPESPGTTPATQMGEAAGQAYGTRTRTEYVAPSGRWPANLVLTHSADCGEACAEDCPVRELDAQSGETTSGAMRAGTVRTIGNVVAYGAAAGAATETDIVASRGGASRFFYVAKPSTAEREEGLSHLPKKRGTEITDREEGSAGIQNARAGAGRTSQGRANHHPTVKSVALMKYLIKLITPPGGLVLDPFMGSGTTGMAAVALGMRFLGWEADSAFYQIAVSRIVRAQKKEAA